MTTTVSATWRGLMVQVCLKAFGEEAVKPPMEVSKGESWLGYVCVGGKEEFSLSVIDEGSRTWLAAGEINGRLKPRVLKDGQKVFWADLLEVEFSKDEE